MPIAVWPAFGPSPAAVGTSPAPVAAVEGADGKVVLANPDVDNVVAADAVDSSVLGPLVVVVLRDVSVRDTGTTSITAPVVLVVFLNGAACRNWLLMVSLALTM